MLINTKSISRVIVFIGIFITVKGNAQVEIFLKNSLDKIKQGHTHVIVGDLSFPKSEGFYNAFKKYWTLTKGVEFLKVEDLQSNLVAGDTYFSLESSAVTTANYGGNVYFYLKLWMPDEKVLRKGKKFKITDEITVALIDISMDAQASIDGYMLHKINGFDFDGGGRIFNWDPGIVKNYLQQLGILIQKGKTHDLGDEVTNKNELKNLIGQTLYCSEDNFHKIGAFMRGDKNADPNALFEDYKYNYKILKKDELEAKILSDAEPCYYLLFLRDGSSKLVSVVNSRTGEVIYSRYKSIMAFILKPGDLKSLYKAIK